MTQGLGALSDARRPGAYGTVFAERGGMLQRRSITLVCSFVLLVAGCFLGHRQSGDPPSEIGVAIAAVSLADECAPLAGRCAPEPEQPEADSAGAFAPCDGPCCPSFCQQSTVTLAIDADGDAPAEFRMLGASLLAADGDHVSNLSATNPRIWTGTEYTSWDEVIGTPSESRVLYDLRDLAWPDSFDSFRTTYRLRLEVEVDGEMRTLTSEETTREAPIVT